VSYVPPAYYADRLCERVRIYTKEFYDRSVPMPSWDEINGDEKMSKEEKAKEWEEKIAGTSEGIEGKWIERFQDNDGNSEGP
jgi:hypothetical protein